MGWVTIAEQNNTWKRCRIDVGQVRSEGAPNFMAGPFIVKPETDM